MRISRNNLLAFSRNYDPFDPKTNYTDGDMPRERVSHMASRMFWQPVAGRKCHFPGRGGPPTSGTLILVAHTHCIATTRGDNCFLIALLRPGHTAATQHFFEPRLCTPRRTRSQHQITSRRVKWLGMHAGPCMCVCVCVVWRERALAHMCDRRME